MELQTATVNVTIQDFVASVVSELVFRNMQQVSEETMFIFPVDSNTVVHTFCATMGDSRIEAMLWEKEEVLGLRFGVKGGVERVKLCKDFSDTFFSLCGRPSDCGKPLLAWRI